MLRTGVDGEYRGGIFYLYKHKAGTPQNCLRCSRALSRPSILLIRVFAMDFEGDRPQDCGPEMCVCGLVLGRTCQLKRVQTYVAYIRSRPRGNVGVRKSRRNAVGSRPNPKHKTDRGRPEEPDASPRTAFRRRVVLVVWLLKLAIFNAI